MSIVRKYKLWKLGIKITDSDFYLFQFVESTFTDLKSYINDDFPDCLLFDNYKDEQIIYYWQKFDNMYINYRLIWNILETRFELNNKDISDIVREVFFRIHGYLVKNVMWLDI